MIVVIAPAANIAQSNRFRETSDREGISFSYRLPIILARYSSFSMGLHRNDDCEGGNGRSSR
jgi:hypothetical protein